MERQPIESSQMRSVGFSAVAVVQDANGGGPKHMGILEIEFSTGAIYKYNNVEQETFNAFMLAESKGKFFGANIKPWPGKYPFVKVRDSDKNIAKMEQTGMSYR